jgi:hypothetical protein
MSFDAIWLGLVEQKPATARPEAGLVITSAALKHLLRRVYDAGKTDGTKDARADRSIFDEVFGKGR